MTPNPGFILEGKHVPGCFAADPEYQTTYITHCKVVYRAKDGSRRGSSHSWKGFRCNNPVCEAVVLVRWDVLATFVTDGARGDLNEDWRMGDGKRS